jgi:hypothetical protein
MAYLNAQEREALANKLRGMKFNRAKGHVRRLDPDSRLSYLRNVMRPYELHTRFELPGAGVNVTLIEYVKQNNDKFAVTFTKAPGVLDVIVEPTTDNQT